MHSRVGVRTVPKSLSERRGPTFTNGKSRPPNAQRTPQDAPTTTRYQRRVSKSTGSRRRHTMRTHRSFPRAERHPITSRARSFRDQSSVSLSDANGRNTRTPHKPVDCRSRTPPTPRTSRESVFSHRNASDRGPRMTTLYNVKNGRITNER